MPGHAFYPIICTDKLKETINFYEDHFGFRPYYEIEYYAYLNHPEHEDMHIGIADLSHPDLPPNYKSTVSGMMLSFFTDDIQKMYDELYMEGVDLASEIKDEACGRRHFGVIDPNGIMISVSQTGVEAKGNLIEEIRQDYDAVLDKVMSNSAANA